MTPRPTKRLKEGMLVTYKRGWIVPCGNGDRPVGVWREAEHIRMANGSELWIERGVQVGGDVSVLLGKL